MERLPCWAQGLGTPILHEVQMLPDMEEVIIFATVKCLADADAVEGSEQ